MTIQRRMICAIAILALAACSDFSSGGTSMPGGPMPPMNEQNFSPGPGNGMSPMNAPQTAAPKVVAALGAPAAADTAVWPFAQAGAAGLQCPQVGGYSCILHFNEPTLAATSKKPKPTATPSPSPSPSPSASGSPTSSSPSPSPSPTPAVTLALQSAPKDVPALPNPDPKAISTTALLALRVRTSADVTIEHGAVRAEFTLPAAQIPGHGFAVALFSETTSGKKQQRQDKYLASYSKSTLTANTLRFAVTMPSVAVKKDETWLFVLYGDERPDMTPSPSASPLASASPAVPSSPAPLPNILTAPVPSASP